MDKPLHILIVASWFPSHENPTEATFIFEQAQLLSRAGHKVHVLVPKLSGSFKETLKGKRKNNRAEGIYDNISYSQLTQQVWLPSMRKLFIYLLNLKAKIWLKKYMDKNGQPNIIHSHAAFMGVICGSYLSRIFTIPIIHTEHTSGLIFQPQQYSYHDIQLLRKAYQQCKKVLFVSQFAAEKTIKQHNIENISWDILQNLVNSIFFKTSLKKNQSNINVLCVGNFIPVKNPKLLLDSWKIVQETQPSWQLIWIGEGIHKNEIKKKAKLYQISDSILWKNRLERKDLVEVMNQADIVVSTSQVETFGLSLAEGMALGKPILATDSGGPRDFIHPSTGIILNNPSPEIFANQLLNLGKNLHQYSSEKIRQYAFDHFHEDVILEKLESSYINIILKN